MKCRWFDLDNTEIVGLSAVPFFVRRNYDLMLTQYQTLYLSDLDSQQLGQKIINLHPRVDSPGVNGLDLSKVNYVQITKDEKQRFKADNITIDELIFFYILPDLNEYKEPQLEEDDIDHHPPWKSEDSRDDLFADCISKMGSPSEAIAFMTHNDIQSVLNIQTRLHSISLGPKEREKRGNVKWFFENQMNIPGLYDDF